MLSFWQNARWEINTFQSGAAQPKIEVTLQHVSKTRVQINYLNCEYLASGVARLWIKVQKITLCIESHSPESSERQTWWRWRVKESTDGPAKERVNAPNGSLITLIPHGPSCLELSLQTFQTETGNLGRLRMQRIPSSPDERSFLSCLVFEFEGIS